MCIIFLLFHTYTHALLTCNVGSVQSFQQDEQPDHTRIQEATSTIVSTLSKRHNSTIMLAVIEVKVETGVAPQSVGEYPPIRAD